MFQKRLIKYSQCWEYTDLIFNVLKPEENDIFLSITSGGDNTLSIIANSPKKVVTVDMNKYQNFLFELKLVAIKQLKHNELKRFIGINPCSEREKTLTRLTPFLHTETIEYWNDNINLIQQGILHIGKFEHYFKLFRRYVIFLSGNRNKTSEFLATKPIDEQIEFYNKTWKNKRWNLIFKFFLSEPVMKRFGRSKTMFNQNSKKKIGSYYKAKFDKAFTSDCFFENSYMEYIYSGNYHNHLPYYLNENNSNNILNSKTSVEIENKKLYDYLKNVKDNTFSKYNLSDIFEALNEHETNKLFHEIYRTAQPRAKLIFWNNLVKRDVPKELNEHFIQQSELENELLKKNKVFFYEKLYAYNIKK